MTRPVYIYTLCERGKDEVRYVGQTVNPEQRLKAHVSNSWIESSRPRERWIAEVILMGGDIEMRIIEECAVESAGDREKHWIAYHLGSGSALTNISHGAASRFASGSPDVDTKSKVAGFRLSDDDISRLETIAIRLTDGSKTDAVRLMIREKYDHLMASDIMLKVEEQARQIEELRELVQQLINKTP